MRFGYECNFYFLKDDLSNSRNRGRNYQKQYEILEEAAKILQIKVTPASHDFLLDLVLRSEPLVIDWRVNFLIKDAIFYAERNSIDLGGLRNVKVFVNGADFLQSFSSRWNDFRGPRFWKDNRLWRYGLKGYEKASFIFPGFSHSIVKSHRFNRVEFISREKIQENLELFSQKLIIKYFPKLESLLDSEVLFINPECSDLNLFTNQILNIKKKVLRAYGNYQIIFKMHPATENSELFFKTFVRVFGEKKQILDSDSLEDLQTFPLEFFLIGFTKSRYIGYFSTSISIIDASRIMIIKSGNKAMDKTVKRASDEFHKFIKL